MSGKEEEYREKVEDLLTERAWLDTIFPLAAALLRYLHAVHVLPWQPPVPDEAQKDIARFAILCMEVNTINAINSCQMQQ